MEIDNKLQNARKSYPLVITMYNSLQLVQLAMEKFLSAVTQILSYWDCYDAFISTDNTITCNWYLHIIIIIGLLSCSVDLFLIFLDAGYRSLPCRQEHKIWRINFLLLTSSTLLALYKSSTQFSAPAKAVKIKLLTAKGSLILLVAI